MSLDATHEAQVKDALLPGLEIGQYPLLPETTMRTLIGKKVGDLDLDTDLHIEAIRRGEQVLRADLDTELLADDQLTIIGPAGELPVQMNWQIRFEGLSHRVISYNWCMIRRFLAFPWRFYQQRLRLVFCPC